MRLSWRDILTTVLAILGVIEVFAKMQGYTWPLISSFKGSLIVLSVIGLLMLGLNATELLNADNWVNWGEAVLWIAAAALITVGLFVASELLFYLAAVILGVTWIALLTRHSWHTMHRTTFVASH